MTLDYTLPRVARIIDEATIGPMEKWFKLYLVDGKPLGPGEFVMLSIEGIGEAPFSLCSPPSEDGTFEIAVRKIAPRDTAERHVGFLMNVTTALHHTGVGSEVGIRGPFGKEFPLHTHKGKDLAFIVGGIGFFPAMRPIRELIAERDQYGKVVLLFGARTVDEQYFPHYLYSWAEDHGIDVHVVIEREPQDHSWKGPIGFVTQVMDNLAPLSRDAGIYVVGPKAMFKPVVTQLDHLGFDPKHIHFSTEARMHCGTGHCGHCDIGGKLVCKDGPVFSLAEIRRDQILEAI